MTISELFGEILILDGGPLFTREELFRAMVQRLVDTGAIPEANLDSIVQSILKREALASTGIGQGLAIPNVRMASIPNIMGVLALLREPIEFDSIDGLPVDVVGLILNSPEQIAKRLRVVGNLAEYLRDPDFVPRLRSSHTAQDVRYVLDRYSGLI